MRHTGHRLLTAVLESVVLGLGDCQSAAPPVSTLVVSDPDMSPGIADKSTAQNGNSNFEELLPDDDDLLYEEELLRNPYSLRMWWRYLEARKDAAQKRRFLLYERAISALPGSYKASFPTRLHYL